MIDDAARYRYSLLCFTCYLYIVAGEFFAFSIVVFSSISVFVAKTFSYKDM